MHPKLKLTAEQLAKYEAALGDGTDWPKITNDPQVNHAVDCEVNEWCPERVANFDWDKLDADERQSYGEEARAS